MPGPGRPQRFPHGRQVSVLVSIDDYRVLRETVDRARVDQPEYTMGDLMRDYIRRCLKQARRVPAGPDPGDSPVRRLKTIEHQARRLRLELARNGKATPKR